MEYSDDAKFANYVFLIGAIRYVEQGRRITEDWMEVHKKRILTYRDFWVDMSRLNPDLPDARFRTAAVECETYLGILYDEILSTKTFSVDIYHQLNLSMRKMMESMFEDD